MTNPSCNKALIDDVDLTGRVEFSIQTIGESDLCSEKCHFAITGALSTLVSKSGFFYILACVAFSFEEGTGTKAI